MTQLTEREASGIGPRAYKEPGSVAWSWQTVTALQYLWQNLDHGYEAYARTWQEAEEHAIWEKIPPENPYGTKEAMLERLAIDDDEGAKAKVAAHAAVTKPLFKHEQQDLLNGATGSNVGYLMSRIARERPDILERMTNGEFKSMAAAAREAGIVRKRARTVSLSQNVERVAKNVVKHYGAEKARALGQLLIKANGEAPDQ